MFDPHGTDFGKVDVLIALCCLITGRGWQQPRNRDRVLAPSSRRILKGWAVTEQIETCRLCLEKWCKIGNRRRTIEKFAPGSFTLRSQHILKEPDQMPDHVPVKEHMPCRRAQNLFATVARDFRRTDICDTPILQAHTQVATCHIVETKHNPT